MLEKYINKRQSFSLFYDIPYSNNIYIQNCHQHLFVACITTVRSYTLKNT